MVIEKWWKILKYKLVFLRPFSLEKFLNLVANEVEYLFHKEKLSSFPRTINVETTNICNLRCLFCPTIQYKSKRKKGFISFHKFRLLMKNVGNKPKLFALAPNGEAFLNRDIFKIIKYLTENKFNSMIESSLNFTQKNYFSKIVDSGLTYLSASIDGTDKKIYSIYRVGGDFDKVMKNLSLIINYRKKRGRRTPLVSWQFIIMSHNQHQINDVIKKGAEIGVNNVSFFPYIPNAEYFFFEDNEKEIKEGLKLEPDKQYRLKNKQDLLACHQAWRELNILVNGDVIPCCRLREREVVFGNIFNQPLLEIWNNHYFQFFRNNIIKMGKDKNCRVCYQAIKKYLESHPRQVKKNE